MMASLAADSNSHAVTGDRGSRPNALSAIGRNHDITELSYPLAISMPRVKANSPSSHHPPSAPKEETPPSNEPRIAISV
eukprot:381767-Pyramimonas_sp.AAC.1